MADKSDKTIVDINDVNNQFIPRIPSKDAPKWRDPVEILIKTRAELISFAYDNSFLNSKDIRGYMPVNSYTNPEALFDEDEYMTNEAQEIIRRLEAKQVYVFEKFLKLIDSIKEKELLSGLDVAEAFYAWGFTGLRSEICEKEKIRLSRPLLASENDVLKQSFTRKDVTFLNSENKIYKPLAEGWRFINNKTELTEKIKTLKDKRTWCVVPIETSTNEDGYEYRFRKLKIQLSPDRFLASFQGYNSLHTTINVLSPNLLFLPHKFWGLDNQEIRENLLIHLQVQSLLDYINDIVTVKSNASSYYMYRALSLSNKTAVETILYYYRDILLNKDLTETKETAAYISENGKEALDEINALKFELAGIEKVFSVPDEERNTSDAFRHLRDKVLNGEINLDGILSGSRIDSFTRDNGLSDFLKAAMTKLDYSFEELVEEASKINPTPTIPYEFILEKKGLRISFDLYLRNNRLQGYKNDYVKNQCYFAENALHWCVVTDVYNEPGEKLARHVAVRLKTWPHYKYKKNSDNSVTAIEDGIKEELLKHYDDISSVAYDTALIIYRIYSRAYEKVENKIKIELSIGPEKQKKTLYFDVTLVSDILETLENRFEGTLELSNYIVIAGKPNFLIINAIITPYWVCPLFEAKLESSSLFLAWKYGLNNKNTYGYEKCVENGWLSDEKRNSIGYSLSPTVRELVRLTEGSDKEYDIRQYCYRMVDTNDDETLKYQEPFKHPYDIKYPNYSFETADELQQDEPNKVTRNKRKLEKIDLSKLINQDFTMDLYNIVNAPKVIEPAKKYSNLFNGLKIEEMTVIDDADALIDLFKQQIGDIRVISYLNEIITFEDGTSFKPSEIPNADKKYAIRKLTENIFLAYFRNGSVRIEL